MADTSFRRDLIVEDVLGYQGILDERGINYRQFSREELLELDIADLKMIERKIRDLARTPQ